MRRFRRALPLALLIGITGWLTWREVRQERLDHALITAIRRNDTPIVRYLLHQGADPNAPIFPDDKRSFWQRLWDRVRHRPTSPPRSHDSALLEAVNWRPHRDALSVSDSDCYPPVDFDNIETVQALVEAGANINVRNDSNQTPLLVAANLHKWETMKVLLARHADVNAADNFGDTALMGAAVDANVDMMAVLLHYGADVHARCMVGWTALEFALVTPPMNQSDKRATVACLLQHGAAAHEDRDWDAIMNLGRLWRDEVVIRMLQQAHERELRSNAP